MKPFLIIKTGGTFAETVADHGDFEDWTRLGLGLAKAEVMIVAVHEGEPLPEPTSCCAAVITGSHAMVTERAPWIEQTACWLRQAVAAGLPLLGICFGHQLLADALGGRAGWNPRGRELGTVAVELTEQGRLDPLLGGLPESFPAHVSHRQSALSLPPGATLLASSALEPHQAFRFGSCWGVQFHPEFAAGDVCFYIERLRGELAAEGLDAERLLASVEPTPAAASTLQRFAALVKAGR